MRRIAVVLLGWVLAAAGVSSAAAQAWLTVGGADGSFKFEMPIPFDMPDIQPDGAVTLAYVHQTPELSLRFEVFDAPLAISDRAPGLFDDRVEDDGPFVLQTRIYVAGHRTFRLTVLSTPQGQGDPAIHRFLTSVRLAP